MSEPYGVPMIVLLARGDLTASPINPRVESIGAPSRPLHRRAPMSNALLRLVATFRYFSILDVRDAQGLVQHEYVKVCLLVRIRLR
jgi:hypothetical protein